MVIISILGTLPTHIITSPLTSLCLFCNSCFELLILATEPVSNSKGLLRTLVKYTSITCIIYTFIHFAILLIRQVSGEVPPQVTISFVVEALSFRHRSSFGLLHGSCRGYTPRRKPAGSITRPDLAVYLRPR